VAPDRELFANFERMRREIDELFGDVFGRTHLAPHRRAALHPPVDVSYADDPPRAIVTAALPGIALEELDLRIAGRELHLAGHRRPAESEGRVYEQIEIEHGPFRRVVSLAADVVVDEIRAVFDNGMLMVELPLARAEPAGRPVPIPVGRSLERASARPRRAGGLGERS